MGRNQHLAESINGVGLMKSNSGGAVTYVTDNSANWNTAYSWGNHASAGYATTAYVGTQISNLIASAPAALDTLNELAVALGNDPNFATTVATSIGTKVAQTRTLTINGVAQDLTADRTWAIDSMVYPGAGIAVSTGTAWGTSSTGTANQVVYWGASNALVGSADYTWDNTTKQMVVGLGLTGYVRYAQTGWYDGFIQSAYGNFLFSANLRYNGTSFTYDKTGFGTLYQVDANSGDATILTAASGTAGATTTPTARLRVLNAGRILMGASLPTDDGTSALQVTGTIRQTTIASTMVKVDATGRLVAAVSGTDYAAPGGAGTTTNSLILKADTGTIEGTDLYTFNGASAKTLNIVAGTNMSISKVAGQWTINTSATTNVGTVTSVGGTGTVSGLTLSGTVTSSGNLTLGGTLSLTSGNVTTALGFTPYNSTNPSGYITGITGGMVTTALGFTPYNNTNPAGYITGYTEVDTLATVTARGNSTTTAITVNGSMTATGQVYANGFMVANTQDGSRYTTDFNSLLQTGFYNAEGTPANSPGGSYGQLIVARGADTGLQIYGGYGNNQLWFRGWATSGTTWYSWHAVLHDGNYNSYSPTLTGGGASGTWSINVTGNAATATNVAWTGVTSRPTNLSQFTNDLGNYGGWITGYTETDTLATVTARGAISSASVTINGNINYVYVVSTIRNLWSGGYGGIVQMTADNGTAARYFRAGIANSGGTWLGGMTIDNGSNAIFDSNISTAGKDNLFGGSTGGYTTTNRGLVQVNGTSSALFGLSVGNVNKGYLYTDGTNQYLANEGTGTQNFQNNSILWLFASAAGAATFSSTVTATAFINTSDARLKNEISRDGDMVYFKWITGDDDKVHAGYIAQEVALIYPDQVTEDANGFLAVNYIEVHTQKIRTLEKRIAELETLLNPN